MGELLAALSDLKDTQLIFTLPNADTNGRALMKMVEEFVVHHSNAKAFLSLGQLRYLSCILHVDAVVGNSSSGLIEAPSFKKGTINIRIGVKREITGDAKLYKLINCKKCSDLLRNSNIGQSI